MNMTDNNTRHGYPGLLIVIEGTDGSGRSSQISRLRDWLAIESYGVRISEWQTSRLMGRVIDRAKEQNLLNATTFSLAYAADFADRLEREIIPALKSGLIVLTDRYTYTAYARDIVRGTSPEWVRKLYSFAPKPDLVFYLNVPVDVLLKRIITTTGFEYYESCKDIGLSTDFYESFKIYQIRIMNEYAKMSEEFNFIAIEATKSKHEIQNEIRSSIKTILDTGILR